MRQPKKPARWQLDIFMLVMTGLLLLTMRAQFSAGWEQVVHIVWTVVTFTGMVIWAWANNDALNNEEHQRYLRCGRDPSSSSTMPASRDIPLTPVQHQFLAVTQAQHRNQQVCQEHDDSGSTAHRSSLGR